MEERPSCEAAPAVRELFTFCVRGWGTIWFEKRSVHFLGGGKCLSEAVSSLERNIDREKERYREEKSSGRKREREREEER